MNILIIGGDGNAPGANSVCVRNMAREFMSRGHRVWILASGNIHITTAGCLEGAELWHVPEGYYGRLLHKVNEAPTTLLRLWFKLVSIIRYILLLPLYPNTDPVRTTNVLKKALQLVEEDGIALVVAIHNSYPNIHAGIEIKKRYKDKVRVVSYHLDLRTASVNSSALVRKYIYAHALKSMVKESIEVDTILVPYSGKAETESVQGMRLDKIEYVGFPVYITDGETATCQLPFEKDTINISYIGTLSRDNRDPRYVLSLLEPVSNILGRKIKVHIWGDSGGMESELKECPIACYHGKVENRYVRHIMNHSDFLLNIGNAVAYNMLPSKVFGMFSTGKPILNVVNHTKDATLPYFERYNHSIDIREYDHNYNRPEHLAEEMIKLMSSPLRESDGLFDDFKPETICDLILKEENE